MSRFEEMSVLERQRAVLGRLYNQSQQNLAQFNNLIAGNYMMMGCLEVPIGNNDQRLINKNLIDFDMFGTELQNCQEIMARPSLSTVSNSTITTASKNNDHNIIKKRKAEFYEEQDCKINRHHDEGKSAKLHSEIKEKSHKGNMNCKENSKATSQVDDRKQDYIHVRARRGQATDSHSLAERARREKISKKMKYLQELVPGCNKVTGKAGMLDEIINYVQSLQKQVEFLSMKLAALTPQNSANFKDMDNYMANFATTTLSEYNIIQQQQQQQQANSGVFQMLSPTTVLQQQHPIFENDLQSLFHCQL